MGLKTQEGRRNLGIYGNIERITWQEEQFWAASQLENTIWTKVWAFEINSSTKRKMEIVNEWKSGFMCLAEDLLQSQRSNVNWRKGLILLILSPCWKCYGRNLHHKRSHKFKEGQFESAQLVRHRISPRSLGCFYFCLLVYWFCPVLYYL